MLLAVPIALQSLITIGVNMLDTIMVGTLGEKELSATSLANQFINIYHIFCMGLGMGLPCWCPDTGGCGTGSRRRPCWP